MRNSAEDGFVRFVRSPVYLLNEISVVETSSRGGKWDEVVKWGDITFLWFKQSWYPAVISNRGRRHVGRRKKSENNTPCRMGRWEGRMCLDVFGLHRCPEWLNKVATNATQLEIAVGCSNFRCNLKSHDQFLAWIQPSRAPTIKNTQVPQTSMPPGSPETHEKVWEQVNMTHTKPRWPWALPMEPSGLSFRDEWDSANRRGGFVRAEKDLKAIGPFLSLNPCLWCLVVRVKKVDDPVSVSEVGIKGWPPMARRTSCFSQKLVGF